MKKTVAVVLSGCGYLDGAEIRESVGVLWALSQHSHHLDVKCFAPDADQLGVTDHLTGTSSNEVRNMLREAARITRGKIEPLSELPKTDYDALVMPGGFGVAKNLSSFASEGANGDVVFKELESEIQACLKSGIPIVAVCIAPALVALASNGTPLELTVGATGDASAELEKLGHKHFITRADEYHIDTKHKVITTPAYMYDDAPLSDVFTGIKKSIDLLDEMLVDAATI